MRTATSKALFDRVVATVAKDGCVYVVSEIDGHLEVMSVEQYARIDDVQLTHLRPFLSAAPAMALSAAIKRGRN